MFPSATKHLLLSPRSFARKTSLLALRKRPQHCTFFASSTDHTTLLKESEIHCLPQKDGWKQFVLASNGVDYATVENVPQLHLARILVVPGGSNNHNIVRGAKVVNRTLGSCDHVCPRLLETALQEAGPDAEAWSTLHGLSDWVLEKGQQPKTSKVQGEEVREIARKTVIDEMDQSIWEEVARKFIETGQGDECQLYRNHGGTMVRLELAADQSDYASTCGSAMAVFRF